MNLEADPDVHALYQRIKRKLDAFPDGPEKAWLTCWRQYQRERTERQRLEKELSEMRAK